MTDRLEELEWPIFVCLKCIRRYRAPKFPKQCRFLDCKAEGKQIYPWDAYVAAGMDVTKVRNLVARNDNRILALEGQRRVVEARKKES